jgi:hypothetical protein
MKSQQHAELSRDGGLKCGFDVRRNVCIDEILEQRCRNTGNASTFRLDVELCYLLSQIRQQAFKQS